MATPKKKASDNKSAKPAAKKPAASKAAAKKAAPTRTPKDEVLNKKGAQVKETVKEEAADDDEGEQQLKALARRNRNTPSIFKLKKTPPVVFTLDDVREVVKSRREEKQEEKRQQEAAAKKAAVKVEAVDLNAPTQQRVLGAASLADILGFNPAQPPKPAPHRPESDVPDKFRKYYKLLIELREHVQEGLNDHSVDTLKQSQRDSSGELSNFSSHMADNGTDAFDRDFALSLVANEQEALSEIEAAIQRVFDGSYGTCEITGNEISRERLEAVPFTRYSLEGQAEYERLNRRRVQRQGAYLDTDDVAAFSTEDGDE